MSPVRNTKMKCFVIFALVFALCFEILPAQSTPAGLSARMLTLIRQAGNAESDARRLEILRRLCDEPELPPALRDQTVRLAAAVDHWIHNPRLDDWPRLFRGNDGFEEASPLFPIVQFYRARVITWRVLESGSVSKYDDKRVALTAEARVLFEKAARAFPENRIIRMYLGEPVPPASIPAPSPGAPAWAVYQREALERLEDIIHWWIANRMQADGQYGGGWGDDCEMWRWWMPVLIAFEDPVAVAAQERFSSALLAQPHMKEGYTSRMFDVEHTAEDSADAITSMMFLAPENPDWSKRALRLAELMKTRWTGINERGFLQFKSTYFAAGGPDPDPRKACDTVYHPRAVQPALLYWQRTGDPELTSLFSSWMNSWVDAAARAERGKPAGVIPSAIHWPDGRIGGLGENWWNPGNHTDDPLYVWPSAMGMMTDSLLLTYHMTGEVKYLAPIRSMAAIRLKYPDAPAAEPAPGSLQWCARHMAGIRDVIVKYRMISGSHEFDELIRREKDPYTVYRLFGEQEMLAAALRDLAAALRTNLPGYTGEVRYTDRVLRFPSLFTMPFMYSKALATFHEPDTRLLFSALTGEPGDGLYFPMNAVRWLTPPRDVAALVSESGNDRFEAQLYHFGVNPRPMGAELYLLKPGRHAFTLIDQESGKTLDQQVLAAEGRCTRVEFTLPPRTLCVLRVRR